MIVTDGAFNDTAVARLYGFDCDFMETTKELTDELQKLCNDHSLDVLRGKHWTTDAGYHETWGQVVDYGNQGALCVEMEGVGLFTVAKYRQCRASAIYIVSDVIKECGWSLGWDESIIDETVDKVVDMIIKSVR